MKLALAKRTTAIITSLVMAFTVIPSISHAEPAQDQKVAPEDVTAEDIIDLDTDSTTYDLGQGESMKVCYSRDVRFEEDGELVDYDPSLTEITEETSQLGADLSGYAFVNAEGDSHQYIPENLTEETPLLLEKDGRGISMSLTEETAGDLGLGEAIPETETEEVTTASAEEELPVDAVFSCADTELTYTSMTDGVKETLVLKQPPASNVITYTLDTGGLEAARDGIGGITILDGEDIIAGISPAWMEDASGENYSEDITYALAENADGTYLLSMTIDPAYLETAAYPVTIDPSVSWTGSSKEKDAYVINGSYKNTNFYSSSVTVMPAGKNSTGTHRTYISFPSMKSTVSGKSVTSAKFTCYERNTGTKGQKIGAYRVTASWSPSKITWNNKPGYSTKYSQVTATNVNNTAQTFDLTSYAKGVAGGTADYGIVLVNCSSTVKYASFFGGRASSHKPKLAITYYSKPTTATSASLSSAYVKNSTSCKVSFAGITADGAACTVQYAIYTHDDSTGANTVYRDYSSSQTIKSGGALPSLPDGCYRIFVRGVNAAGTAGGGKSCGDVHVDSEAPEGTFTIPESSESAPGSAQPELSWSGVSDAHLKEIQYKVGDGEWKKAGTATEGTFTVPENTFPGSGTYEISMRAVDLCGNESEVTSRDYYVSLDGPKIGSLKLYAGETLLTSDSWTREGSPEIRFSQVTDEKSTIPAGGVSYALKEEGSAPSDADYKVPEELTMTEEAGIYEGSFTMDEEERSSPDGRYRIYVRFTDAAGNKSRKALAYNVDTGAPQAQIQVAPAASGGSDEDGYKDVITVTGIVSDEGGSRDQITSGIKRNSITVYEMTDQGASEEQTATIYREMSVSTTRGFDTRKHHNGRYLLRLDAEDEAGNTASEEKVIEIRNPIPAPVITESGRTAQGVNFGLTWKEAPQSVWYRLYAISSDEEGNETKTEVRDRTQTERTSDITLTDLSEGTYEIAVSGTDRYGVTGKERKRRFRIDETAPSVSLTSFECGYLYGNASDEDLKGWKVWIRQAGTQDEYVTVLEGGQKVEEGGPGFGFIDLSGAEYIAGGAYELRLTAEDGLGNTSSASLLITREADEFVAGLIEPEFRLKRPEGQEDEEDIIFSTGTGRLELQGDLPSPEDTSWFVDTHLMTQGSIAYEGDFSELFDTGRSYFILAEEKTPSGIRSSQPVVRNGYRETLHVSEDGQLSIATDGYARSFRLYCDDEDASFRIQKTDDTYLDITSGQTVHVRDYDERYTQYINIEASGITEGTEVTVYMDMFHPEYVSFSYLEDYAVRQLRVMDTLNYKTRLSWEAEDPAQVMPEHVAYEVHRSTRPDFAPSEETLAATVRGYTYDEINTDYGGRYYYKVRPVLVDIEGEMAEYGRFSMERSAEVVAADEYLKRLGMREYWRYAHMGTPSGDAYIEKSEGNFLYQQTDAELSSEKVDAMLERTYNSRSTAKGIFGMGWSTAFDMELLRKAQDGQLVLRYPDGTIYEFSRDAEEDGVISYVSSMGKYVTLTESESLSIETFDLSGAEPASAGSSMQEAQVRSRYTMTDKDGGEYRFDEEGKIVYIGGPNGNYVLPLYDERTGLVSEAVTNRGIRMVFTYSEGRDADAWTVSEVSLPDGSSFRYQYSGDPSEEDVQLTSVTHVGSDGGQISWHYSYSDDGMTSLTDGKGNVYRTSYDGEGRAVSFADPEKKTLHLDISGSGSYTETRCTSEKGIGSRLLYTEKDWFDGWFGNCMKTVDAAGTETEYTYKDNLLQMTESEASTQALSEGTVVTGTQKKYEIMRYDEKEDPAKEITDEGVTRFETDSMGNVTSEVTTNADGNVSVSEEADYDAEGNELWSYDEIEDETELTDYCDEEDDWWGEPETEYTVTGKVTDPGHVPNSRIISKSEYSYSMDGNGCKTVTERKTEDGTVTETITVTDPMGRKLSERTGVSGGTTSETVNTYDEFGRLTGTSVTESKGGETVTRSTSRSYDANGSVISETSEDGITTTYQYDGANRVTRKTETKGSLSQTTLTGYAYADTEVAAGDGISRTVQNAYVTTNTQGGQTQITWQNGAGRTVKAYEDGLYTHFTCDRSGNEVCVYETGDLDTATGGRLTLSLHDASGNVTDVIKGAVFTDGAYHVTDASTVAHTSFDGDENIVKKTDELGNTTHMGYDAAGRITELTQPGGQKTKFSYDTSEDGKVTAVTTYADGSKSRAVTSADGRDLEVTDLLDGQVGIQTVNTYDADGNLVKEEEREGNYRTYTYDAEGQITEKRSFRADDQLSSRTTYAYDSAGRLLLTRDYVTGEGNDPVRSVRYSYDELGRKNSFKQWEGDTEPAEETGTYVYDAAGRVSEICYHTDSDVSAVRYEYTQGGRLDKVKADGHTVRSYTYDQFGSVTGMTDETLSGDARVTRIYGYDAYGRTTSMTYSCGGEDPFSEYSYTYDKAGNITRESVSLCHVDSPDPGSSKEYTYDANGWLTQVREITPVMDGTEDETFTSYTYDSVGNRITKTDDEGTMTSAYNGLHQLVSTQLTSEGTTVPASRHTYDDNGNEITEEDLLTGETITMSYDADDRMTSLTKTEDGAVTFTQTDLYDGDGQRIRKTETASMTDPLTEDQTQQTKVRDYFYQDGAVLYTSDDHDQRDFNITGTSGNVITSSRIHRSSEEWYLYNKDIRGSIESVMDDEGHLAARYTYDAFGNTELMEGEEFDNEFGYTGQIYDRSSGLYYYNARYYDPEEGRFTTQDTYRGEQTEPDTYHLYAYCANDPVDYVDPSGHKIVWDKNETFKRIGKRYTTRSYGYSQYGFTANIKLRNKYKVTNKKGISERVKASKVWVSLSRGGGRVLLGKIKSSRHYTQTKGESTNVYTDLRIQIIPGDSVMAISEDKIRIILYIKIVRKKRYGVYIKAGCDWKWI